MPLTVHAVVPSTGLCALNRTLRGSAPACRSPLTAHRGVPTLMQCAFKHTRRASPPRACAFHRACSGPHHKAVHPQPLTQWFPLAGRLPSSTHRGIPTRGPRTIDRARLGPQGCTRALNCTPPVDSAPATVHGVVFTTRLCALQAHEGRPHWALNSSRRGPHSRAAPPQLGTEGSRPAGSDL